MTLVDTSVWIAHLRGGDPHLDALLEEAQVLVHPFVIGELACGSIRNRTEVLDLLDQLPRAPVADEDEVRHLVESRQLWARGVGWVDLHLVASSRLEGCEVLTYDTRLREVLASLTRVGADGAESG